MKLFSGSVLYIVLALQLLTLAPEQGISQVKLNETFDSNQFPPVGWSVHVLGGTGTSWGKAERYARTAGGCAVSEFDTAYGNSMLVTKKIKPSQGDSLVFYLRQTFYSVYSDTLKILASLTDSLPSSFSNSLLVIRDGLNYPAHQVYRRYSVSLSQYAGHNLFLAFQHIDKNGEILRLDDISVGAPLSNDVSISSVVSPAGLIAQCSYDSLIPSATIINMGANSQTQPFTVYFSLTGPLTLLRSVTVTLAAGEARQITFPSINPQLNGNYIAKVYTALNGDQDRSNDTSLATFEIRNYTHGGGTGGYFYATSELCGPPASIKPEFCWKDTAGSTVILRKGQDITNRLLVGDADDGYFDLSSVIPAGKFFSINGVEYRSLYVSINGLITFEEIRELNMPYPPPESEIGNRVAFIAAPFWTDLDGSNPVSQSSMSYKIAGKQLLITFNRMLLKSYGPQEHISFQAVLELKNSLSQNSGVLFNYNTSMTSASLIEKFRAGAEGDFFAGIVPGAENVIAYRYKHGGTYSEVGNPLKADLSIQYGSDAQNLNSGYAVVTVWALIEGMQNIPDTAMVMLHDFENPSVAIESKKVVLNSAGPSIGRFTFGETNQPYLISIKHRNSVHTWCKDSALFFTGRQMIYDFTVDSTRAYASNMTMINGKAHIFSGDVNGDGIIDLTDMSAVDNDASEYVLGYVSTDLTGDLIVDSWDKIIVDNNVISYISVKIPPRISSMPSIR